VVVEVHPKVSALKNYKLAGFSVEHLIRFLTALGQDLRIVIRNKLGRAPPTRSPLPS